MIRGNCPICGRVFNVDDRYAGLTGKCKSCGADVQIPGEPETGLNGLPPMPGKQATAPPPQGPPTGAPELPPEPAAPEAPPPQAPAAPHREPAGDARSHFEPDHGPTALGGHFLAGESATDEHEATPPPSASRSADEALVSRRILTPVDSADAAFRPKVIQAACVVLALLGLTFSGRFAWAAIQGAGVVGGGMAVVGLAFAALGVIRVWTGHWDGLIPAFLCCLLVLGGAFLLASAAAGEAGGMVLTPSAIALLAGDGLAILLLALAVAMPLSREYLSG